MTIIDELLILLDDLDEATPEQIPTFFDDPNLQVIFSSLGRLVNRGWADKKTRRNELSYTITSHVVNELNSTLDAIKKETDAPEWDRQWRQVIFDIPESKRKLRDNFRIFLKEQGFGMLTSSVWISPWNKEEILRRYTKRNGLNDNVFYLTTTTNGDSYQSSVFARRCWNWEKIEKDYKDFLDLANKKIRSLKENDDKSRFEAKKLVFRYAEIVKEDPALPSDIAPNAGLVRRAQELYVKIRPFCLKNN